MKCYIGIDPGANGSVAFITDDGKVHIHDFPGDERSLTGLLDGIAISYTVPMVCLEYQQSFPGQGISATFKLGVNYGIWLSAIASQRWPLKIVRPAEWKKGLGYPLRDTDDKAKHKKESKAYSMTLARRLYPQAAHFLTRVKDNDRAEALLLAHLAKENFK